MGSSGSAASSCGTWPWAGARSCGAAKPSSARIESMRDCSASGSNASSSSSTVSSGLARNRVSRTFAPASSTSPDPVSGRSGTPCCSIVGAKRSRARGEPSRTVPPSTKRYSAPGGNSALERVSGACSAEASSTSASIGSTPTMSNAVSLPVISSGVTVQVAETGLPPARNWMRDRLERPGEPRRSRRATCPLMGTGSGPRFSPLFLSLAWKKPAAPLRQSSVLPSADHSQAGRASAQCTSTRRAVGDLIHSASTRVTPSSRASLAQTALPRLTLDQYSVVHRGSICGWAARPHKRSDG